MNEKRQCSQCHQPQLEHYRVHIGTSGTRHRYRCVGCGAEASHGTVGNAVIGLLCGLVLVPTLAFVVKGYSLQSAPKAVFIVSAVLVGAAIWELFNLRSFRQVHPPALKPAPSEGH